MVFHSVERIEEYLKRVLNSYEKLKKFELDGCTKEELRKELIELRDACEELMPIFGQAAKEVDLDINKFNHLVNLKPDFLEVVKIFLMQLSNPQYPSDNESLKNQANMIVTMMNLNGKIDLYRLLLAFLSK